MPGSGAAAPLSGSASSRAGMVTAAGADSEISSFTSANWPVVVSGAESTEASVASVF